MDNGKDKLSPERQELVEKVVAGLEQGKCEWRRVWGQCLPENAVTGYKYNGINSIYLSLAMEIKGWTDNRWVTFNQIKNNNLSFKKDENGISLAKGNGVKIEYVSFYDKLTKKAADFEKLKREFSKEEYDKYYQENIRFVCKSYVVFNGDLVDGLPEKKKFDIAERNERAEEILSRWSERECPITADGGNKAYYSPTTDTIHTPRRENFFDIDSYYAVTAHEMIHSTGHSKRLNRDMSNAFGTSKYAIEELTAEFGAVFMSQKMELNEQSVNGLENHTAYIDGWLKEIKSDPSVLFKTIKAASAAADYITARTQENEYEREEEQGKSTQKSMLKPEPKKTEQTSQKPTPDVKPTEYKIARKNERLEQTEKHLPKELKDKGEFVVYKQFKNRKGEPSYSFYSPKNSNVAKSDKADDCVSFDEAVQYAKAHSCDGVALRLSGENGVACLDLDKVQSGLGSRISDELTNEFKGTYTEQGNKGVRIFFTCDKDLKLKAFSKLTDIGFYQRLSFIPLTGESVSEKAMKNFSPDSEPMKTVQKYFEPLAMHPEKLTNAKDIKLLEESFKSPKGEEIKRLMLGEVLYADRERSDLALATYLALATSGDRAATERLYLASGRENLPSAEMIDKAISAMPQPTAKPLPSKQKGKAKSRDKQLSK